METIFKLSKMACFRRKILVCSVDDAYSYTPAFRNITICSNITLILDYGSFDAILVLCQTICVRVSFLVETSVFFVAT